MAQFNSFLFWVDLIVGLYIINLGLKFVTLPIPATILPSLNQWTNIIAGALIILGGIMSLTQRPQRYPYRR
jgi:cytochrome c biogenesis protein CcdA